MVSLRVIVAPDSFKGTARAARAAEAIAAGWASVRAHDELVLLPMADGGEGTLDAFDSADPGARRMPLRVRGALGDELDSEWLWRADGTAVIELARASGIESVRGLSPFDAHTFGFGQLIADALDHGANRLLLAVGGSASTDGGTGALAALGARFLDRWGEPVPLGNRGLEWLATAELSGMRPPPAGGAIVLSDVDAPLLGSRGAAAVFGPQKGATAADVEALESNLAVLATLLGTDASIPGSGAAGGTGFGLLAWGARIEPGAAAVAAEIGLPAAITGADLVITGEGQLDAQSATGKVVGFVGTLAARHGVEALLVAGVVAAPSPDFSAAVSLSALAGSPELARALAAHWLFEAGAELARRRG